MTGFRARALSTTALAAAAVFATLAVSAPADAAQTKSLMIEGELEIADLDLLAIKAVGATNAEGKTTGTYEATLLAGDDDNPLPFKVKGPITCIHTDGDTASLVYPISATDPNLIPAPLQDALAVQITVRKGDPSKVGVNGPAPTGSFSGCEPAATPYEFDGDIEIK
ncbi:hypothetical protein QEN40_09085 [Gordonia alkanivorans]|jgi:hypothetical protein|uniref:Uncharacterized protein n=1 Tax=Gordonia alkanivorans NBRC 16433 TaxID=1027371 RepID=F9VZQ7_9ACTN|nr:hypothetical protein [Gordonia alkanivorans]MDH3016290.1 hypothetical protein [Gordonia alkanivorans]MDH3041130.1 hypothetical protein [Gordonia alkanivorans]MDH3061097.1 hypothetical protein [Gordonia alkanivorans]GAA14096.1 hypothetical protein GOALK_097_01240 [Gordonia alkanivorans NBRC 16433]